MKKTVAVLLAVASLAVFTAGAFAAEKMTLGKNNFAVKIDSIQFDDTTDDAVYVGAEGYKEIEKNLYLGGEVGYTSSDGKVKLFGATVHSDVTFLPIELNLKYAVSVIKYSTIDFGVGGSFNYAEEELSGSDSKDEWLFGGQCFLDVNVILGKIFLGINGKIQFTDKGKDTGKNYSNQRFGGQIGIIF